MLDLAVLRASLPPPGPAAGLTGRSLEVGPYTNSCFASTSGCPMSTGRAHLCTRRPRAGGA
eukprot:4311129-Alexandrium_andersonii.AAC.1